MRTPDAAARLAVARATGSTSARGAGVHSRVGERALPRLIAHHWAFAGLSIASVATLLVLTRGAWFWHDEWMFIRERSFADPASWFLPHAEHFVAVHAAVYTTLLAIFGTSSYLPYLAVTWVAHIAFAAAVYAFIDRHVGRGPAIAGAALVLFLGTAGLNLYWGFQMGAIGSGALAMYGLLAIRDRPWLAALLLGLAVATQGFALFFVPAAVLYGWSRRALLACAVPVIVYGGWYLLIGRDAIVDAGAAPTLDGIALYIPAGIYLSAAALTGLGPLGVVLILAALPLLWHAPDRRAAFVGLVGLLTEYTILGLSRAGQTSPGGWQYIYFGAAFLVLTFAMAWPGIARWARPAAVLVVVVALVSNLAVLVFSEWGLIMSLGDPLCSLCRGP